MSKHVCGCGENGQIILNKLKTVYNSSPGSGCFCCYLYYLTDSIAKPKLHDISARDHPIRNSVSMIQWWRGKSFFLFPGMREKRNSITKKGRNVIGANQSFFPSALKWKIKEWRETKKENIDIFDFFDKCFDYFVRCLRFLMVAFKLTFVSVLGQSFSIKCLWAPNFIAIEYHAFENAQRNKIEQ